MGKPGSATLSGANPLFGLLHKALCLADMPWEWGQSTSGMDEWAKVLYALATLIWYCAACYVAGYMFSLMEWWKDMRSGDSGFANLLCITIAALVMSISILVGTALNVIKLL